MAVEIKGVTLGGNQVKFQNIVEFRFQSDRFTPADDFTCTVLDDAGGVTFVKILFYYNKSLLFEGMVDCQEQVITERETCLRLECRSLSALSLDNEACPGNYFNLTGEQLVRAHGIPYGIKGHQFPYNGRIQEFLIPKGTSHWETMVLYCRKVYGKVPFLDRNKKLRLTPFSEKTYLFSNSCRNGIRFQRGEVRRNRCQMFSKLYIRVGKDGYLKMLENSLAERMGVTRERYYNPSAEWKGKEMTAGEAVVKEKQLDYFEVSLTIPGILPCYVGDLGHFQNGTETYDFLYLSQVVWEMNAEHGMTTQIKLWDKRVI